MAHRVTCCRGRRRPRPSWRRSARPGRRWAGFTLIELLVVIAIASVLLLIGAPALMNVAARYKVHSSAQQFEMLGRQARYESIKLNQPVTLVADTNRNTFYVFSGSIAGMPPWNFPDGQGDIPPAQRVAVWPLPHGVSFSIQAPPTCTPGTYCQSFQFAADGSGTGQPVTFSTPNQPSYTVTMVTQATGKLAIQ
ncbi:MAG: prepilin-type N-terminal cleavage/methylation domain-containing protein [Acidobacteria bacterium]|nr:prepilin-type N-terminal cleavage/methylation domain-containing protein [Acidobacteriota bacterium]